MTNPRESEPGPQRAALGDPGIYIAQNGEKVKVRGFRGDWKLIEYGHDRGGDFAVVFNGHERIVTVDRLRSRSRRRAQGTGSR